MSQVAKMWMLLLVSLISLSRMFSDPAVDAVEGLLEVFDGVGKGEPQIAFALPAECRAGKASHAGFIQQRFGKFGRTPTGLFDVRKRIESSLGHAAMKSRDAIQPV